MDSWALAEGRALADTKGKSLIDAKGRAARGWALLETRGRVSVEGEWEGDGESCLDDGDTWRC